MRRTLVSMLAMLGLVVALAGCAGKSYNEGGADTQAKPYIPPGADAPGDMPGRSASRASMTCCSGLSESCAWAK